MNIRDYIKNNFKNNQKEEICEAIKSSIKENDEITLPGLGVFFELLWNNSNDIEKNSILNKLEEVLK